jgi:hypothetical protein
MPNALAPSCCWRGGSPQVYWATMAIRVLRPTPEGFLIAYRPRCCREEERVNMLQVIVPIGKSAPSLFLSAAARLFPAIGRAWGEAERLMVDFAGQDGADVAERQLHCHLSEDEKRLGGTAAARGLALLFRGLLTPDRGQTRWPNITWSISRPCTASTSSSSMTPISPLCTRRLPSAND